MSNKYSVSASSVSAVLFCYNESLYIGKAIQSLQSQSVAVEEIIVVDDFSSDGTVNIVKGLARQDQRIRCLTNAYGKGKVGAYQTGLEAVRTRFFFVMGADDEAKPDFVLFSLQYIEILSTPFFFHSAELIDENSNSVGKSFVSTFDSDTCFYYNKTGGLIFGQSDVIQEIIPFPPKLEFEDWYTVLRLFERYGHVETSSLPQIRYRIHPGSDSQASRWNWKRRKNLITRDIRFLELMLAATKNPVFSKEISQSIKFRTRLICGCPTLGQNIKVSFNFGKTFISVCLSKIFTCLTNIKQ